jgi:hypothetical protein
VAILLSRSLHISPLLGPHSFALPSAPRCLKVKIPCTGTSGKPLRSANKVRPLALLCRLLVVAEAGMRVSLDLELNLGPFAV